MNKRSAYAPIAAIWAAIGIDPALASDFSLFLPIMGAMLLGYLLIVLGPVIWLTRPIILPRVRLVVRIIATAVPVIVFVATFMLGSSDGDFFVGCGLGAVGSWLLASGLARFLTPPKNGD